MRSNSENREKKRKKKKPSSKTFITVLTAYRGEKWSCSVALSVLEELVRESEHKAWQGCSALLRGRVEHPALGHMVSRTNL